MQVEAYLVWRFVWVGDFAGSNPVHLITSQTLLNVAIAQRSEQDTVNIEMEVRFFLVTIIISNAYSKR
jgi:hypothetical protein